jgi:uncharacterized protein
MGEPGLCATCGACDRRAVCGGGYLPHRHASATGFSNPSLYCRDLYKLIAHIEGAMRGFLARRRSEGAAAGVS